MLCARTVLHDKATLCLKFQSVIVLYLKSITWTIRPHEIVWLCQYELQEIVIDAQWDLVVLAVEPFRLIRSAQMRVGVHHHADEKSAEVVKTVQVELDLAVKTLYLFC